MNKKTTLTDAITRVLANREKLNMEVIPFDQIDKESQPTVSYRDYKLFMDQKSHADYISEMIKAEKEESLRKCALSTMTLSRKRAFNKNNTWNSFKH